MIDYLHQHGWPDGTLRALIYIKYILICAGLFFIFRLFLNDYVACVVTCWIVIEMIHDPENADEHKLLHLTEIHIFPRPR